MSTATAPMIAAPPRATVRRASVVLYNISWGSYQALLHDLREQHYFLTYDRGTLEIMPPKPVHEKIGKLVARLVETMTLELRIPIVGLGSTTWYNEHLGRGLEADQCYYV